MKDKKWTIKTLEKVLRLNVTDYGGAIAVAAYHKKIYGVFPKIGLSGAQAEMANELVKVLPTKAVSK